MDVITYWNDIAQEANRTAHTTLDPLDAGARGPVGSSRAFAIVHLAMHDAYFTINPAAHGPYLTNPPAAPANPDTDAAVAAAAHATLSALYPSQKAAFEAAHLAQGLTGPGLHEGHLHGLAIAGAMLAARRHDPGSGDDGHAGSIARGDHRPDPDNPGQGYYAPFYGAASSCFASTMRHQLDAPPALGSAEYDDAVQEVRARGIAPELMGTLPAGTPARTAEETMIGLFWAYDGSHDLGTPPRLYNQIIRKVAEAQGNTVADNARLFAMVNAAMADAGILAWDEKYAHNLWRPIIGVREHDPSLGPDGQGGSVIDADADPDWRPLGAPSSNSVGKKNFTPNFPAYPSGHATFGAAAFQVTRRFYKVKKTNQGPDTLADGLSFVSDELDGRTVDNRGAVRTRHVRQFPDGLWQMIEENGLSRVYLGVHWVFDAFTRKAGTGKPDLTRNIGGVRLGIDIANDVADHGLVQAQAAGSRI